MVWQHISPEVTVKGFKKCRISNALDGTDEICLEEDGDVRSEWEKEEGTVCEDEKSGTDR
jgi:hypothetical protein